MGHPDLSRPVGSRLRDETPAERADRNCSELLQELRVMQTGVQVLTGFLLTLPFQARFAELDTYQRTLYLVLVVLAVVTTGVLITPVSLHRGLLRKGLKRPLVAASDELARVALVLPVRIGAARAAREACDADAPGTSSTPSAEEARGSAPSGQVGPARKNGAP